MCVHVPGLMCLLAVSAGLLEELFCCGWGPVGLVAVDSGGGS